MGWPNADLLFEPAWRVGWQRSLHEHANEADRPAIARGGSCHELGKDNGGAVMNSKAQLMRALVILAIVSLLYLAGCGGGTSHSFNQPQPTPPPPAGVAVSPTSPAVQAGGEQQFNATVTPT